MTKRVAAKHKIDRRLGVNLWGREKSPLSKRNYGPGQHGMQRKKLTDYGVQLKAKQKLKWYYGEITEKQFKNTYLEAVKRKGDSSQNLIGLLERRLDTVIYRMKFASTIFAARQIVSHGHILVNGKRVDIPSARVSEGDEIQVSLKFKENSDVLSAIASKEREVPGYCEVDHTALKGKFLKTPSFEDVPYPVEMEPYLVIEFYSR